MVGRFLRDRRGNYALLTALIMMPIMGVAALAVDYAQMSRQRQMTLQALDAAGIATARRIAKGANDEEAKAFAKEFFLTNLSGVKPSNTELTVVLPNSNTGGGTLMLTADLKFDPVFFPFFQALRGNAVEGRQPIDFSAQSEIRLKNTLEVALVLDNSGSMRYEGDGSSEKRIDLLKDAAKELVSTLAENAGQMKQIVKPVQIGLVPFAASVNVGSGFANAPWMDTDGVSPIHHENFDWSTMSGEKRVEQSGGVYYKRGGDWGDAEGGKVTRFTLYQDLKRITGYDRVQTGTETVRRCRWRWGRQYCWLEVEDVFEDVPVLAPVTNWTGCVEMRPGGLAFNDAEATATDPKSLFVPMFAPDESDRNSTYNDWWDDVTNSSSDSTRQAYMPKYFTALNTGTIGISEGPNLSCTTKPITPLKEVSKINNVENAGLRTLKSAIDDMQPEGATNVTQGIAWGWRVLSQRPPFSEGRPSTDRGNDKVVIVLTDGANTYYTPKSLGANDPAGNKSIYSSYGYARNRAGEKRIFDQTSGISRSDYSNSNYTAAMTQHMGTACTNAKAERIMVITVALDLSASDRTEAGQIEALRDCASESRFRKDENGNPAKLFYNATGASLKDKFREIADELSNLRIVG